MDETITRLLAEKRIEPIIVVGIDNAGRRQRPVEYLPYPDGFLHPPTPRTEGRKYPEFLIDEVIPFIRRTYRTRAEPGAAGIGGSSYGAVAALFAAIPSRSFRPTSPRESVALHFRRAPAEGRRDGE